MKKGMTIITVVLTTVALLLGGFTVTNSIKSNKQFIADGYILDPSKEEAMVEGANMQYYFNQGGKYKEKFGTSILFKNQDGEDTKLSKEHFIHYSDGSLGAFTKGVLLDVSDLDQANYGYYSLTKNTILVKNGNSYELSTKGEALSLDEYVWKISDTDYMLISPTVTLTVGNQTMDFEDYAQISYVDNGIVRISHLMGTYQTISAESALVTESGAELNLVGKSFMLGDGEMLSLDDLALNDDSYIKADDTDENKLNIPTFNVINGKDGASGTNGENGESGEQGESGDQGIEGEAGSEGSEGSQGTEGSQGSDGSDGVAGADGSNGFDGKEGNAGFDGANAAGASSLASAKLNLKPTITMSATTDASGNIMADSYKVTANTATMSMELEDTDSALASDDTRVYVYDKKTMKLASFYNPVAGQKDEDNVKAIELGASLAEGNLQLAVDQLDPDTEYIVVVKGSYAADSANTLEGVTLFSKTFKTEAVGVSIAKLEVTEKSISVKTTVTDSSISGYTVIVYNNDDPSRPVLMRKTVVGANDATFKLEGSNVYKDGMLTPAADGGDTTSDMRAFYINSNTQYYARLERVNSSDKTGDTEISLHTLRVVPYDKKESTDASGNKYHLPVTAMKPTLTVNNLNSTMIVSLDPIVDEDSGIKSFRYELVRVSDDTVAASKETETYQDQTFEILDRSASYYARVIAVFDNYETTVELTTLISDSKQLEYASGSLVAGFEINNTITSNSGSARYDKISGYIVIQDIADELHFSESNLALSVNNSVYGDADYYEWTKAELDGLYDAEHKTYRIFIELDELRPESATLLSLYAPYDTNGDGSISMAEKSTRIATKTVRTVEAYPLALAITDYPSTEMAFRKKLTIVSSKGAGWSDATGANNDTVNAYSLYEARLISEIHFKLYYIDTDGYEQPLGNVAKKYNENLADPKNSTIGNAYRDRSSLAVTVAENGGLTTTDPADGALVIDPGDFAFPLNDNRLYQEGYYKIKVDSVIDYANNTSIKFDADNSENYVTFVVARRHVASTEPNSQVKVDQIKNVEADSGYEDTSVSGQTVVGLSITPYYTSDDAESITYTIYKYGQNDKTDLQIDGDGGKANTPQNLYPGISDSTSLSYGLEAVMQLEQSANSTTGKLDSIKLYFDESKTVSNTAVTVKNGTGSATITGQTVLERGYRYIIAYKVKIKESMHSDKGCYKNFDAGDENRNIYPNCAYNKNATESSIPLYRSKLITLNKQIPLVERYPFESNGNDSVSWNYRIDDPDGALDLEGNKLKFTIKMYEKVTDSTPKNTIENKDYEWDADKYSKWHANESNGTNKNTINFTGLTKNQYYTTTLTYKLNNAVTTSTAVTTGMVLNKGEDPVTNLKVKAKSPDPAIVSNAGYMFRVTLQGADLKKLAAARVTVSGQGTDLNTYSVVYDPVWIKDVNTVSGQTGVYIGYADLDTSPLSALTDKGVTEATVEVKGYYSTGKTGFKNYNAVNQIPATANSYSEVYTNDSLDGETLFTIRASSSSGDTRRILKMFNGSLRFNDIGDFTNNSLFLPGITGNGTDADNLKGFILKTAVDTVSHDATEASMIQRYPSTALSVSDFTLSEPVKMGALSDSANSKKAEGSLDATGFKFEGNYYYPEELAVADISYENVSQNKIQMEDLLPAVEKDSESVGCMSAVMTMNLLGSGAKKGNKIYAVVKKDGNELYLKYVSAEASDDGEPYLAVSTTAQTGYYRSTDTNFVNNFIEIDESTTDGHLFASLRLKDLEKSSTYKIVFCGYDTSGTLKELYSIDGPSVGYVYSITTMGEIQILANVYYELKAYNDKKLYASVKIDGLEVRGYKIQCSIDNSDWYSTTGWTDIDKLASGMYPYKELEWSNSATFNIGPENNFAYGTAHQIRFRAVEENGSTMKTPSESTVLGTKTVAVNITSVEPSFAITTDVIKEDGTGKITGLSVTVTPTDTVKTVPEYEIKLDGQGVQSPDRFTINTMNASTTETFNITDPGVDYTVTVTAKRDKDNKNVTPESDNIVVTKRITLSTSTKSESPAAAYSNDDGIYKVKIVLKELKSFANVKTIIYNINTSGHTCVKSGTFSNVTPNSDGEIIEEIMLSSELTPDNYTVYLYYQDEAGNPLGNDSPGLIVN